MRCRNCNSTVPDDSLFCPVCGFELGLESSSPYATLDESKADGTGDSPGVLWYVALLLLALTLVSAAAAVGVVGALHGLEDRRVRARQSGLEHYRRGLVHLEEGNYLLAAAEFEEALRLAPDWVEVQDQLTTARSQLDGEGVSASVGGGGSVVTLYEEARALYADHRWPQAIARLEELRRLDMGYRGQEAEEMLFDAHHQHAMGLMKAGELEEALMHLDSALQIRADDQTVSEQRLWLSLYLTGLAQWGVDWEKAVEIFEELYELNPDFLDSDERLHDAYLELGDLYYEEGAWCVAEEQYGAALQIMVTEAATSKRDEAGELCLQAISAATPSVLPSAVATESYPPTATVAPSTP